MSKKISIRRSLNEKDIIMTVFITHNVDPDLLDVQIK